MSETTTEETVPHDTSPPADTVMLSGRGLRHSYGPTKVLRGVDLDVGAGEVVAVMGPSVAGALIASSLSLLAARERMRPEFLRVE